MLPKLDIPVYELMLPTSGKAIKYRPFTVKEKKLFLLVRESQDVKDVVSTIKQVVQNCIVSPEGINVENLAIVDIEFLFVNLRARSVGEVIEIEFECNNVVNGSPCKGLSKLSFNLLNVAVEQEPGHSNKIQLTEKVGVVMKYPTFAMSNILDKQVGDSGEVLNLIVDCIDYVYNADGMYYAKDEKREDLIKWFEDISEEDFTKIQKFFDTSPRVIGKSQFNCSKCAYTEEIKLQGIQDFFG